MFVNVQREVGGVRQCTERGGWCWSGYVLCVKWCTYVSIFTCAYDITYVIVLYSMCVYWCVYVFMCLCVLHVLRMLCSILFVDPCLS